MTDNARSVRFPVSAVPLSADVEVRVQGFEEAAAGGEQQVVLDVRLYRRCSRGEVGFCSTSAGLRIPLHLSGLVSDAIRQVATRAAEQLAIAPLRPPA
jgi:hypothetical protein